MNTEFSLNFSDRSGDYHLQLKEVDHQAKNIITISGKNYKIKGNESAITQLKSHLKVDEFENMGQFKASLQENVGIEKKVSVVFQKIKNSDEPDISKSSTPVEAEHAPRMSNDVEAISAIQSKLMALDKENKFSGTVIIVKREGGDQLIAKSIGLSNIELNEKNTLETQFNIASIGKMFTTVAVLQLLEEGKLSLEDPIEKFLPQVTNEEMKQVTIQQLLTHTSGAGKLEGEFRKILHFKEYIEVNKDCKPEYKPGTDCKYSNLGFVFLGAIIEKASEMDFYEYIQERIFKVAEMQHSSFPFKTDLPKDAAVGYMVKGKDFEDNQDVLPLRATPAGCGYSTGPDLIHFSKALLAGKEGGLLQDPKSLELIQTPLTVTTDKHPSQHSMGFMTGDNWFGHAGHYDGANGELRIYPQAGYIVSILANRDQEAASDLAKFIDDTLPL